MNVSFVVIGSLLAIGGALGHRCVARGPRPRTAGLAMLLLVVSGINSAAVGFVPLDVDGGLHALVATPVFVAQPVALVLLGSVLLVRGLAVPGAVVLTCGVVATIGALVFVATLASVVTGDVDGLFERVALWPANVGVAVLGWGVLRARHGRVWETEA